MTQIWYFYLLNVKGLIQTQHKVADGTVKLTLNCIFIYTTNNITFNMNPDLITLKTNYTH